MRSRKTAQERLPSGYAELSGRAVLDKLADDGELAALEAFWRYGDPSLCAEVIGPMLRTEVPHLVELALGELLGPSLSEPFPSSLMAVLNERRPKLTPPLAARLTDRLRDKTPLEPTYENGRHVLEVWALEQGGKTGEDFAISVIARETPMATSGPVRESALQHCRASERVLAAAARVVAKELDDSPTPASWQNAAEFIEGACRNSSGAPEPAVPIVKELLRAAPQLATSESFGPELTRLIVEVGLDELEALLSEVLPDAPGSRALLRTIANVRRAGQRAHLFALAVREQPHLWAVLEPQVAEWSEEEWKRNLKALVGDEQINRSVLVFLLNGAPLSLTATMIELALNQATAPGDQPLDVAAKRLQQKLSELGTEGTRAAWVVAVHWAKRSDEPAVAKLAGLFGGLEQSEHVRLVVRGFLEGKLDAQTAASLLPANGAQEALALMPAGEGRGKLAAAIAGLLSDEIGPAVAELRSETGYAFDLARALAPIRPDVAFAGADKAFRNSISRRRTNSSNCSSRTRPRNRCPSSRLSSAMTIARTRKGG